MEPFTEKINNLALLEGTKLYKAKEYVLPSGMPAAILLVLTPGGEPAALTIIKVDVDWEYSCLLNQQMADMLSSLPRLATLTHSHADAPVRISTDIMEKILENEKGPASHPLSHPIKYCLNCGCPSNNKTERPTCPNCYGNEYVERGQLHL